MRTETELRITGYATSPGLVVGKAFVYRNRLEELSAPQSIEQHQIEDELARVERALETVRGDLKLSAERIEAHAGPKLAAIFEAHEVMLEDPSLRREIRHEITGELIGATQALARVFVRWQEKFRSRGEMNRDRADDLVDLQGRLLREMAGVKTTALEKMPPGRILVAHRLLPSETVALPRRAVLGIVLEFGGPGSHGALLARALGIPTVAQIPNATQIIADGQELAVDGISGEVTLNPDVATRSRFEVGIRTLREEMVQTKRLSGKVARTLDGSQVSVMANVGCFEDVIAAAENGADGVGLYRIEQFYLSRTSPPGTSELLAELRKTFAPVRGKPVTVRLLDLGADKPVPFLNFPIEDDPFLGRRGVRLLLRYPDLLDTQFRALLEFSLHTDIRILVPMVTMAEDMAKVRQRLRVLADDAGIGNLPPLGAMIETPAAALTISDIAQHSDFFSIGTNDLTQYTMAAGRENPLVNDYFIENHPSVLRLVGIVLKEAGETPVAICGELAARSDALPILLKLGVRNLSVAPPFVPTVKEAIRQTDLARL